MGLAKYFSKRHFGQTPEPKGKVKKAPSKKLAFVVQEHHASQLHYDFRLELDGVLKSWAVPKGPSMNPADKHLAVAVEDHPYAYRTFEGTIPKGSYGAGTVTIWDEGHYEPRQASTDQQAELRKGLAAGHLTFILYGKRLRGEFALIKMHGTDEDAWLLVKKADSFANKEDTMDKEPTRSITAEGKAIPDDTDVDNLVPDINHYPKVARPWAVKPMLSTLVDEPFDTAGWLFEVKWDGYRAIGSQKGAHMELYSRMGTDFSLHYPAIASALQAMGRDVILDGEIVAIDAEGRPHFEWLQAWRKTPHAEGKLVYNVFDILWLDGHDVRAMPLLQRKALLKSVLPEGGSIRYSDHILKDGTKLFAAMQAKGLEGIVAKRADSPYSENARGQDWLKIKTHYRQEVVIGGFTEPRGTRAYLGSLLVGVYENGEFVYTGHSGGGIPDDQRKILRERLDKLERKTSPFASQPTPNAPVHWVRPEIICEMSFSEWTEDGFMRHPAYEGLRVDKKPEQVHKEKPSNARAASKLPAPKVAQAAKAAASASAGSQLVFTHLDKIFFPKHKYTKGDLITYYQEMAPYIMPYLQDRPLSLLRQPGGVGDKGFFQKNMEHLPDWVPAADIYSETHKGTMHWMVCGNLETLLYAVQLGSIEINPWNSRIGHLEYPDWIVIDLDPEGIEFTDVISVAQTVKKVCDEWGIDCYPKTSGKTGIHIFIPMAAKYTYEQARNLAHLLAIEINKREPKRTSIERNPAKRPHKIYLDYLQNRESQTLAAPYSVRPTPDATVSTPLHWDEIVSSLRPTDFNIKNIAARLQRTGDLWKPVTGKGLDLTKVLDAAAQHSTVTSDDKS